MSTPQPEVVSDWAPADKTANHLELALTNQIIKSGNADDGQQLMALRDTFNPGGIIYVTPGQLRSLGQSVTDRDSPAGRLLAAASGKQSAL